MCTFLFIFCNRINVTFSLWIWPEFTGKRTSPQGRKSGWRRCNLSEGLACRANMMAVPDSSSSQGHKSQSDYTENFLLWTQIRPRLFLLMDTQPKNQIGPGLSPLWTHRQVERACILSVTEMDLWPSRDDMDSFCLWARKQTLRALCVTACS